MSEAAGLLRTLDGMLARHYRRRVEGMTMYGTGLRRADHLYLLRDNDAPPAARIAEAHGAIMRHLATLNPARLP